MKKTSYFVLTFLMIFLICGCKKNDITYPEPSELINKLVSSVSFDGELNQLDESEVSLFYNIDKEVEAFVFQAGGTICDEASVFITPSEDIATKTLKDIEQYISDKVYVIEAYQPEESKKLNDSVLIQKGNYVVLCVTSDKANANKIIEEAFK